MIEFFELTKLADKQKWESRFVRAYDGGVLVSDALYGPDVRFIVATRDGKELGFIRINDKSSCFRQLYDGPVWNITDAYVKPAYCDQGVFRSLIVHAVSNLNVKMIYMQSDKYERHCGYFQLLGFSLDWQVIRTGMTWAFIESFADVARQFKPQA